MTVDRDTLARTIAAFFVGEGTSTSFEDLTNKLSEHLLAAFVIRERDQTPPADPPEGMTAQKLRKIADWMDTHDQLGDAYIALLDSRSQRAASIPTRHRTTASLLATCYMATASKMTFALGLTNWSARPRCVYSPNPQTRRASKTLWASSATTSAKTAGTHARNLPRDVVTTEQAPNVTAAANARREKSLLCWRAGSWFLHPKHAKRRNERARSRVCCALRPEVVEIPL